jgi:aryl-alcohol dehydrogenase-like predicted oxidoreductase
LPAILEQVFHLDTPAQRAIQFVRSSPGVGTALIGMKQARHVEENLAVAKVPPASLEQFMQLFERSA